MSDLFISYSRKDLEFVRRLDDALKAHLKEAWIDWNDIPPAADFPGEIRAGIEGADAFVFVLSPDSALSPWCQRELEHALSSHKRLLPMLHRRLMGNPAPGALAQLNWINFRENDDFEQAVKTLITALDTDLEYVRPHTRLGQKGREWEHAGLDDSFLLRGKELQEAEGWLGQASLGKQPSPTELHTRYIQASQSWQRRELVRWQEMYQKAISRQLAAQAELLRQQKPSLLPRSLLLAVESMRRMPSVEADAAIRQALALLPPPLGRSQHAGQVYDVAFSPDGAWLASASSDGAAQVWDIANQRLVSRVQHAERVNCLAFSRNGKWLATGSSDKTACIWEASSGKLVVRLVHDAAVARAAFGPDGAYLLTVSGSDAMPAITGQGAAWVWEAATGRQVVSKAHSSMTAAAFSPDGRQIASGSDQGQVLVWDALTGAPSSTVQQEAPLVALAYHPDPALNWLATRNLDGNLWVLMLNSGEFLRVDLGRSLGSALAFSPQGSYLASAGADYTATIWQITDGKLQGEVARLPHSEPVEELVFSPDGSLLCSTSFWEKTARVWQVQTGREMARIAQGQALKAAFSPDGRWLASASDADAAWVWDLAAPGAIGRMAYVGVAGRMAFSPDGRRLLVSGTPVPAGGLMKVKGQASTLTLLDIEGNQTLNSWQLPDRVQAVAFDPGGSLVACACQEHAWVWDAESGRQVSRMTHATAVKDLVFSRQGGRLATASEDGAARVWDASSGGELVRLQHAQGVLAVALSPDGQMAASTSADGSLLAWSAADGSELWRAQHSAITAEGWYLRLAFSADGRWLASSAEPKCVQVWESASGKEVARCDHQYTVVDMRFSPDGARLVTSEARSIGGDDHGLVHVWEAETGKELARKQVEHSASAATFSPDGRWIAAGLDDGGTLVWDAASGNEIVRLSSQNAVIGVAFSPDGRWLASLGTEGDLKISLWRPEDLIAVACSRLARDLSPDEWRQYVGEEEYRPVCP